MRIDSSQNDMANMAVVALKVITFKIHIFPKISISKLSLLYKNNHCLQLLVCFLKKKFKKSMVSLIITEIDKIIQIIRRFQSYQLKMPLNNSKCSCQVQKMRLKTDYSDLFCSLHACCDKETQNEK